MARIDKDAMDALKLVREFLHLYGHDMMEDRFYTSYHFRHNFLLVISEVDKVVIRDAKRSTRKPRQTKPKEIPTT
jgi:hypothetical protein